MYSREHKFGSGGGGGRGGCEGVGGRHSCLATLHWGTVSSVYLIHNKSICWGSVQKVSDYSSTH